MSKAVVEIGLMAYPECQLAAVYGLADNFSVAQHLAQKRLGTREALLRVSHLQYDESSGAVVRTAGHCPGEQQHGGTIAPDIIIVPPRLAGPPVGDYVAPLAHWLAQRHTEGAVLAAVCGGAFLLAEAGVLNGRRATTHWAHANTLAERFGAVKVDASQLIIDDGDIITAGGAMAWIDLGLKIVERLLGPAAMVETARFLLVDPPGREQRNYSAFSPKPQGGDGGIQKVRAWLQTQGTRKISIKALAELAGMEERTFLRRFQQATGYRPTEYCQRLRMERAKEILEASRRPIDQIAWDVGYEDATAFRKIFMRVTGLSPVDYRKKFGAAIDSAA